MTKEGIPELMEYLQGDPEKITLEQAIEKQSRGLNAGKSNRITIKRLMQMDVSVFFVSVNQGLFLCICKPVKLCYNIMLYRAKVRAA